MNLSKPLLLSLGLAMSSPFAARSVAVTASAGSGGASSSALLPLPLERPYILLRPFLAHPDETALTIKSLTASGRVLAAKNIPSPPAVQSGDILGYRWHEGQAEALHAPLSPWIYGGAVSVLRLNYSVSTMNDAGIVVGMAACRLNYYDNDFQNQTEAGENLWLGWPSGNTSAPVLINPGINDAATRLSRYYFTSHLNPKIDDSGKIHGTGHINEWADKRPVPHSSSYRQIARDDLFEAADINSALSQITHSLSDPYGFYNIQDLSPNGKRILQRNLDTGPTEFVADGKIFTVTPLGDSWQGYVPRTINNSGRFAGFDYDARSFAWGTPAGELHHLAGNWPLDINNHNDILGYGLSNVQKIWAWPRDPQAIPEYIDNLILTIKPDTDDLVLNLINDAGILSGSSRTNRDSAGNMLPINLRSSKPVLLIPAEIAVDANRDGVITLSHQNTDPLLSDLTSAAAPFRFWSNDDDDNATAPLGVGMDYLNNNVDGAEDLKDFFPVFLDIKQLLVVLPHTTEGVVYKLKHQQEALNFVYTSLTRATAFQYRTDHSGTGYGVGGSFTALDAPTARITAAGVPLHAHFLDRVKDQNQGVILVEMRNNSERPADELAGISGRVTQPLQLVVEKDGVVIAELALPLKSLEVAVRKKGEAVPDNGVLVKTGDIIEVALDEDYFAKPNAQQNRFTWQLRQRKADGAFDEWADFGAHGKGTRFEHTTQTGGVFQIRALFNGTDEVMYKRKKSERFDLFFAYGPGSKSEPDSIGVCDTDIQIAVCLQAQGFYASEAYDDENTVPAQHGFPEIEAAIGSIRCNIFVAHMAVAGGAVVPAINGHFNEWPPQANEWAGIQDTSAWPGDPTFIEGWPIMPPNTRPQPGWIIAHPKPGDSGHCAITDYDGEGIGAGTSGTVNKNFHLFWDGTSRPRRYTP